MGILDDIAKLKQLGAEQAASYDVKSRLAQTQAKLDQMNAAFAPAATSPEIEARRISATATVSSASQIGAWVNNSPAIELQLIVMLPGGIPLPVTRTEVVPQLWLGRIMPGAQLAVSLDPTTPESLRVDWEAQP
jgi:hypothetical protein